MVKTKFYWPYCNGKGNYVVLILANVLNHYMMIQTMSTVTACYALLVSLQFILLHAPSYRVNWI